MKKILFALLVLAGLPSLAQTSDTLRLRSGFSGFRVQKQNESLTLAQAQQLMEPGSLAFAEMQSARSNNTWATIIGVIGGGMVGYTVGAAIGKGNPNWTVAAVGGGLIVASIPLSIQAKKRAEKAVGLYNAGLRRTGRLVPRLRVSSQSLALQLSL
jgi:hypothetical protein